MSLEIELFRGPDFEAAGTLPLVNFLQPTIEHMLGVSLDGAIIHLAVLSVPDDSFIPGSPVVYNLLPDYGYAYVSVVRNGNILYKHPHTIEDIVTQQLQAYLRSKYPDELQWGFRLLIPGLPRVSLVRPKPLVDGVVGVRPFAPGEQPGFSIRRLADASPPEASVADFGVTPATAPQEGQIRVLVPASLHTDLGSRPLSNEVEEGGFLLGQLYRDRDSSGSYLLHITTAPAAEHTGASLLHFTFTGDSFAAVKRKLREQGSVERILGWYHTHLFAATEHMGLSSVDFKLHFSTFTHPWQVAGLINLDGSKRVLRFYVRQGEEMALCPHLVTNE